MMGGCLLRQENMFASGTLLARESRVYSFASNNLKPLCERQRIRNCLKYTFQVAPFRMKLITREALTVELGLLERLNLADVDVLHGVDALDRLKDLSGDVLGDAARQITERQTHNGRRGST